MVLGLCKMRFVNRSTDRHQAANAALHGQKEPYVDFRPASNMPDDLLANHSRESAEAVLEITLASVRRAVKVHRSRVFGAFFDCRAATTVISRFVDTRRWGA